MADRHADHSALTILVTGAGSGIGEGLARGLAAAGHHVVVSDYDADAAHGVAAEITTAGGSAEALRLDVTSERDLESVRRLAETAGIDVLVNNAGLQHVARLESFPPAQWRRLIDVMLTGTALTTQAVLPSMRERGFGRVVSIGSVHSLVASPFKSAYVAAKHGLLGFARTVALENADFDFTINTVCPAYVRTPLVDNQIADQAREHGLSEEEVIREIMLKPMPKGQFISMEELTGIVEFLVGPAARNITAQTIVVDGGWTAR